MPIVVHRDAVAAGSSGGRRGRSGRARPQATVPRLLTLAVIALALASLLLGGAWLAGVVGGAAPPGAGPPPGEGDPRDRMVAAPIAPAAAGTGAGGAAGRDAVARRGGKESAEQDADAHADYGGSAYPAGPETRPSQGARSDGTD